MRGFILNMIMVFIGFYLTIVSMFLANESFKRDSIILTMIESAKIASIANLDDSARVEENYVDIIDMTFEENFEKLFYKNLNINVDIKDISYKYLKDKSSSSHFKEYIPKRFASGAYKTIVSLAFAICLSLERNLRVLIL